MGSKYCKLTLQQTRTEYLFRIVASLVRAQPTQFLLNILQWLLVAIPATACNSLLSYIQSKLAIAYRTRLTQEVLKQYLGNEEDGNKIYYKMGNSFIKPSLCQLIEMP